MNKTVLDVAEEGNDILKGGFSVCLGIVMVFAICGLVGVGLSLMMIFMGLTGSISG